MGRVLLAEPRAFCAGVTRAVQAVERALQIHGAPVYVRRQIVHNRHVVARLERLGAIFVQEAGDAPPGSVVVLSAHGVAPDVFAQASSQGRRVVDATCPLVAKVHREARRFASAGFDIFLVGEHGHDEVLGVVGVAPASVHVIADVDDLDRVAVADPAKVAWLAQTTLAVDEAMRVVDGIRRRFPSLVDPPSEDICYAAQNRQAGVRALAAEAQLVLVVGSVNSHNSRRLVDVAVSLGRQAHLVDDAGDLDPGWLAGVHTVGVTGGASAPPDRIDDLLAALAELGYDEVTTITAAVENQVFALPRELEEPRP
jgi:4-hydroxy-3-methylbut-2-enyl diphosphate reductase